MVDLQLRRDCAARTPIGSSTSQVADIILHTLRPDTDEAGLAGLRGRVDVLASRFPLYPTLTDDAL